jgi:O-antigen ligase
MSTSLLAGFHVFLLIPILLTLKYFKIKNLSKSQIAFLLFSIAGIISVIVNQDIESRGFSPMTKIKYYVIAVLGVYPTQVAFDRFINTNKRKKLFSGLLFFASLATIAGLIALYTQKNPLTFKPACHPNRNCGMAGMYMNYAHSLNYFVTLLLGLIIYKDAWKNKYATKWVYWCFGIALVGFYLSFTRGAWLGFLAAIPFVFLKKNKKLVLSGVLAMIVIASASYFFLPKVYETFNNRQQSNDERIGSWKAAIKAFEERPFLGFGLLNFEPHSSELKHKYQINNPDFKGHAHNIFLEFLATTGGIGFTLFLAWLTFWIMEMYARVDLVSNIAIPVIVAFMVGGLTQSTFVLADNTFFITAFYIFTQVKFK